VVDRPRPRVAEDLSINHGGFRVYLVADVVLEPLTFDQPSMSELVCVRAVVGQLTAIIAVAVVYRPGSAPVLQLFFDELAAVLEQLATYQPLIYIAGDFNIRIDRPDDSHSAQFRLMVDCYSLMLHHTSSTPAWWIVGRCDHERTRGRPEHVDVVDVGLSDHHLLSCRSIQVAHGYPPLLIIVVRGVVSTWMSSSLCCHHRRSVNRHVSRRRRQLS